VAPSPSATLRPTPNGPKRTKLDRLRPSPDNPRRISKADLERLKKQIASDPTFMTARPICAMPDGRIYAGEMRWRALTEMGESSAPVYVEAISDELRQERMARDNTHPGDWVPDEVAAMLAQARDDDRDLQLFGFDEDEVDGFLARVDADQGKNPDKAIEPAEKPITKKGDLWELGPHRLICGDATRPDDVAKVRTNGPPGLMVADPPYGVDLDHGWRESRGANRLGKARSGKMTGDDVARDWSAAYQLSDAPVAYVWHGGLHADSAIAQLETAGYERRSQIIWVKSLPAFSRGHYHWIHEPCWYVVKRGKAASWRGGRKQTTVWEAASPLHIMGGSDEPKTDHPTQKPILLYERAIRNHLARGATAYDPFSGSGTIFAAAERTERIGVGLEVEPRWVDAAVQRWEELSGGKAKRVKA
jgi:DNA modification methylase